jgi:hypothetical protein
VTARSNAMTAAAGDGNDGLHAPPAPEGFVKTVETVAVRSRGRRCRRVIEQHPCEGRAYRAPPSNDHVVVPIAVVRR